MKYIITGIVFGFIYVITGLEFSMGALLAGMLIGGITGAFLAPFSDWIDAERAFNEANPVSLRQYIKCTAIAIGVFGCVSLLIFRG